MCALMQTSRALSCRQKGNSGLGVFSTAFMSRRGKSQGLDVTEAAVQADSCGGAEVKLEGLQSSAVWTSCL